MSESKSIIKELKKYAADYSVLYIEDNPGLRMNLDKLLTKVFDNVYTAGDGKEGFEMFKQHQPDIILTDINMPEMNGVELVEKMSEEDMTAVANYIATIK